ncbi:hypothetical protein ACIQGZ_17550 [Streptomyces sp. NPDC092296]|uniref:hypothetical protein n=1 Tax=Streptomyces sp. NPDC092296 TaxID=3366012 RepID=UPI0038072947
MMEPAANAVSSARFLYVIGFADGVVKVGQTQNMPQRFRAHQCYGRRNGATIERFEIGLRHGSARPDEKRLIAFCAERWPVVPGHSEFFVGADFDEVADYFWALEWRARDVGYLTSEIECQAA